MVSAYLLKRQGYDVVGVGIIFPHIEEEKKDIDIVKDNCAKIGIPFYTVEGLELYNSKVGEFIVASKLSGQVFSPELATTNLVLEIIYYEMKEKKIQKIATGHYGRIIHDGQNNCWNIYASKDEENDQSRFLAFMPREIIPHLKLPLSSMRQKEIEKVAKALELKVPSFKNIASLMQRNLSNFVKKHSPDSMREEGPIINYFDKSILGQHSGIYEFCLGRELESKQITSTSEEFIPIYASYHNKSITVMEKSKWIPCDHIIISNCVFNPQTSQERPFIGHLEIDGDREKILATIYYLNNYNILCILKKKYHLPIFIHTFAVIYTGKEKVILGGFISKLGHIGSWGRIEQFPALEENKDNGLPKKAQNFRF